MANWIQRFLAAITTHKGDADAHHALGHGVAQHADVARDLFVPPSEKHTGAVGNIGWHPCIELVDDANTNIFFEFKVPDDFVLFTSLLLVWVGFGGVAGQDWLSDVPRAGYDKAGEAFGLHEEAPANQVIDVTALNTKYETDIGFTLPNLAKGDHVGVFMGRAGTDGLDTYTGIVKVIGFVLYYTAEQ